MKEYRPKSLPGYFTQAIEVQHHAFKESFAKYKFEQSCETLIRCGFCSSRKCSGCKLHGAHESTLAALKDPKEVERRYRAYCQRMNEKRNGVIRSKDKKGHITYVLHHPSSLRKEVK